MGILKEKRLLEDTIGQVAAIDAHISDCQVLFEFALADDADSFAEGKTLYATTESQIKDLELRCMLDGEADTNDTMITINAGAGGTESCDWVSMLLRMYLKWAQKQGYKADILSILAGEEAGVKNVSVTISGLYAYGFLKAENGIHRLVRISPFDSNARRHTSFASVFATPIVDDNIDIQIEEKDLKIDTYRAQGAGGQHVNTTDSAVRITHVPTNIIVQCQKERSQHQNKDVAMKLLRSKLYEREMEARLAQVKQVEGEKKDIAWGSQIRSYVLHPYNMVKDHRTNFESSNPNAVLDGDLNDFIQTFLMQMAK